MGSCFWLKEIMSKVFGVAGLLIGLMMAGGGGQTLVEQTGNQAPRALSFAQFEAERPTKGHLLIDGATLCLPSSAWVENRLTGEAEKMYVAAFNSKTAETDVENDKPIALLVKIDAPKIVATMQELIALEKGKNNEMQILKWMMENQDKVFVARPLRGIVAEGVENLDSDDQRIIDDAGLKLAPGAVVLQENARPRFGVSIFMIIAGLGLCAWGVLRLTGRAQHI